MSTPNDTPDFITIQLTQGYSTVVDAIDSDLAGFKWCVAKNAKSRTAYAQRAKKEPFGYNRMHRIILSRMLGRELEESDIVNHIDGDGLNNRRSNLRLATISESNQNKRVSKRSKSGFKGVYLTKQGTWRAVISTGGGKMMYIGTFPTCELAYLNYCRAAETFHADFAPLEVQKVIDEDKARRKS